MKRLSVGLMSYAEMSLNVRAFAIELERRNPIFVNAYTPTIFQAADLLQEISLAERRNFTSESGPREGTTQRSVGRPRTVAHDPAKGSCSCIDCRKRRKESREQLSHSEYSHE